MKSKPIDQTTAELLNACLEWMETVTGILAYQPDIPLDHKKEIAEEMMKVRSLNQELLEQLLAKRN